MPSATTREALIDTTQALLWERGYAATSPRAILDRAGVGQGSMYHHFAGKEALAVAAFERSAEAVFEKAATMLSGEGSAVERINAYLLLQREVLRGCPVGRRAGDADVLDSAALRVVLASTFDRIRALTVEVVAQGIERGELRPDVEPSELADTILAVVQGGYVLARAAADPAPFERAVHGAVALLGHQRQENRP
jgi:TetR/AcrR family transcriptional repressor of nem operon